ncbi:ABC transporter permease [Frankia sp. Cppng1_Ct_nod]|uniref:ABC transporter permease n=1 Tax=Frankia sp. Cppng1_Ct_nod TaxID=2897162 RepID=UPI0010417F1F|nr:ABC transporter permease [Frankia sp. Cppng1_Ct_nod]
MSLQPEPDPIEDVPADSGPVAGVPVEQTSSPTVAGGRWFGRPAVDAFGNAVRSEWTKLWTVRSTYWTLTAAFVITIGLAALVCAMTAREHGDIGGEPAAMSLTGIFMAQIAVGVLGVLVISSEYGSGMIRTTFAAVPDRLVVLAAKAVIFAFVVTVGSFVACLAAFVLGQWLLSPTGRQASLGDAGMIRIILGATAYLTLIGLIALGLGGLIRHTAGALGVLFGLMVVLQIVTQFFPVDLQERVVPYLPGTMAVSIITVSPPSMSLSAGASVAVLGVYAVVALLLAFWSMVLRDA